MNEIIVPNFKLRKTKILHTPQKNVIHLTLITSLGTVIRPMSIYVLSLL